MRQDCTGRSATKRVMVKGWQTRDKSSAAVECFLMAETPVPGPAGYSKLLGDLKQRIQAAQLRASLAVNRELVFLYWQIGRDILARQERESWGAKVIDRLAGDLKAAFPEMKGFSPRNLKYMRAFAEAWPEEAIVQQLVAQIPSGHCPYSALCQRSHRARVVRSGDSAARLES